TRPSRRMPRQPRPSLRVAQALSRGQGEAPQRRREEAGGTPREPISKSVFHYSLLTYRIGRAIRRQLFTDDAVFHIGGRNPLRGPTQASTLSSGSWPISSVARGARSRPSSMTY